jgi:hypothetical protein
LNKELVVLKDNLLSAELAGDRLNLLNMLHIICNDNEQLTNDMIREYMLSKLDDFIKDVKNTCNKYYKIKKRYTDYKYENIAQIIFGNKDFSDSKEEADEHIKYCLIGIIRVLIEVKEEVARFVSVVSLNKDVFLGRLWFLYYLVFHIQEYLDSVEAYKKQDASVKTHFFRKRVLARETLYLAMRLPRNDIKYNDISQAPVAAFLMRQAIELRILELLQIVVVWNNKTNRPVKMTADVFFPLLKEKCIQPAINITLISKIHTWANPYVHMGGIQYLWEIEIARKAIENFICKDVLIPNAYMKQIPLLALNFINDDIRADCEVIMSHAFKK